MGQKLSYGFFLPRKLSNDSERRAQVLTILLCENPSNIWELNYGLEMCGAKMELVLQLNE